MLNLFDGNLCRNADYDGVVIASVAKIRAGTDERLHVHRKSAVVHGLENFAQIGVRGEYDFADGCLVGGGSTLIFRLNVRPLRIETRFLVKGTEKLTKAVNCKDVRREKIVIHLKIEARRRSDHQREGDIAR